jgi:disulfide bond formation protein DsbB
MPKKIPEKKIKAFPSEIVLNCFFIYLLVVILLGVFLIQYFFKEEPCSLCLLQRIGMLGMAAGALMNIKYGSQRFHYGVSLVFAIFGGFVALRQIALHICPGFPTFGKPFWGLSLYTWSFLIFCSSVGFIALMLILFNSIPVKAALRKAGFFGWLAFLFLFLLACANCIYAIFHCGLGPCEG